MILTDLEETLSEEQLMALETLRRMEGSAWLGRDLRQMETGARLNLKSSTMSRVRVWTNSFAVAAHIQREAIAKEGPLHNEELFYLLEAVIPGEASSRERKFVQRLSDTAEGGARGLNRNIRSRRAQRTRFY